MAYVLRLTDAGRAAIVDGTNIGTRAVTLTKMALGAGQGPGGAADDALTALRDSRNSVELSGSTMVAGRIAFRADFTPTEDYDVTEVGLMGRIGSDGTEALYAYWSDDGTVLASAVTDTTLVIGGSVDVTPSAAEISVTISASITLGGLGEWPLWTLPLAEVATSDQALPVTAAAATDGGKVSVAAGTKLSLGEEITAGETGVVRVFTTEDWESADLAADSEYYLRAKVVDGSLTLYTQQGLESDTAPASLRGTVDGTSGGGFPSTPLDARLARIVTGAAGTAPSVTSYRLAANPNTTAIAAVKLVLDPLPGRIDQIESLHYFWRD